PRLALAERLRGKTDRIDPTRVRRPCDRLERGVGTQLNFGSASYREYKCNPSDQFDGLIWCQKARTDKERRGSYITAHSLLHSQDGSISYINRRGMSLSLLK